VVLWGFVVSGKNTPGRTGMKIENFTALNGGKLGRLYTKAQGELDFPRSMYAVGQRRILGTVLGNNVKRNLSNYV
jgi:hypothetical protein